MNELLEVAFSPANIAASSLLCVMILYWTIVAIGASGLDLFDFDVDFEAEVDSFLSVGMVTLDFLNIGRMPIMIWMSVFSLAWWGITIGLDHPDNHEHFWYGLQSIVLSVSLAVILTKILTQPLRGRFDPQEPNRPEELVGKAAIVTTSTVSDRFGQARLETEAAPLLLNVRCDANDGIVRGDRVILVDFDPDTRLFRVKTPVSEAS